jgi:O-antigen/teichoic acid export membrane protein
VIRQGARIRRLRELARGSYGLLAGNVAARLGAMGAIMLSTLLLARQHGAAAVGVYTLMHVLPALLGSLTSCGLGVAAAYFLAGPDAGNARLPLTLVAVALIGGAVGLAIWVAATPLVGPLLFPGLPLGLVAVAGFAVVTRLMVITAKSCSQGKEDLRGSNFVILAEEAMFVPVYLLLTAVGTRGYTTVILGLVLSDVITGALAWSRLARKGFFAGAARPSLRLARRLAAYGTRGQVGGLILQLNLRLDFIILTALAGPAVLGMYAIGSKFAELIKVGTLALSYVLYPEFARDSRDRAAKRARRLIPKAALLSAAAAVPLFLSAGFVITTLYGRGFHAAILPARIILLGLVLDGVGGVVTGYLYGVGRPGLNSWSMGMGLVFTVALDVLLIPRMGATGAAIASALAYTASTLALLAFFSHVSRGPPEAARPRPRLRGGARRGSDVQTGSRTVG